MAGEPASDRLQESPNVVTEGHRHATAMEVIDSSEITGTARYIQQQDGLSDASAQAPGMPALAEAYKQQVEALIKAYTLDAYLSFTADVHLNEYIGPADQRVTFLTGFTGSNGTAITAEKPCLITDSRYFIQATQESSYPLYCGTPTDYLREQEYTRVSFDRRFLSRKRFTAFISSMKEKNIEFVETDGLGCTEGLKAVQDRDGHGMAPLIDLEKIRLNEFIKAVEQMRVRRLCWCRNKQETSGSGQEKEDSSETATNQKSAGENAEDKPTAGMGNDGSLKDDGTALPKALSNEENKDDSGKTCASPQEPPVLTIANPFKERLPCGCKKRSINAYLKSFGINTNQKDANVTGSSFADKIRIARQILSSSCDLSSTENTDSFSSISSFDNADSLIFGNTEGRILISDLDTIAWLLNIRGADISYNPVFYAFLLIYPADAIIFTDHPINAPGEGNVHRPGLRRLPYSEFYSFLRDNPCPTVVSGGCNEWLCAYLERTGNIHLPSNAKRVAVCISTNGAISADEQNLQDKNHIEAEHLKNAEAGSEIRTGQSEASSDAALSPSIAQRQSVTFTEVLRNMQSIKNDVELAGMALAYVCDGIALTNLSGWLTRLATNASGHLVGDNSLTVTENTVAEHLLALKKPLPGFVGLSFETISSTADNSAIVHHSSSDRPVEAAPFLLDSGSHYVYGTTDTTRMFLIQKSVTDTITSTFTNPTQPTVASGTATATSKATEDTEVTPFAHDASLVLKGHIQAMAQIYPSNVTYKAIDDVARSFLKMEEKDFGHATGHGVGHFLCVHEAPPSISPYSTDIIESQRVFSIEPGFYKDGEYGIRYENLVVSQCQDGGMQLLNLTAVPYQLCCFARSMLSEIEEAWLRRHSERCVRLLGDFVDDAGLKFLLENIFQ